MKHLKPYSSLLWLLAIGVLVFITNLGGYSLFDVDEPRYAETAREMLTSPGDWITPHFNWVTRFDKPVLFYWLIAFSYKIFGVSEFAARLVSALAATGTMFGIYAFVRNQLNDKAALLSTGIFATMLEVYAIGRWSITDMTLSAFMAGTWLTFFLALTKNQKWYLAAGVFAGLGMLTKGPVALALPGLTLLIMWALYYRSEWRRLFSPWAGLGLMIFFAIASPWYWAVAQANPDEFVGKFFLLHNIERFAGTVSGHSGPWYYFFPVLAIGAFPWVIFLPSTLYALYKERDQLPAFIRFSFIWFVLVFVFFSAAGTKLLTYILPLFPALAILLGWYWHRQLSENILPSKWTLRFLWLLVGGLTFLTYKTFSSPYHLVPSALHDAYNPLYTQTTVVLILITFTLLAFHLKQRHILKGYMALLGGFTLIFFYANLLVMPQAAVMLQDDVKRFAERAVKDNVTIATYKKKKPSLVFYTQRKVLFVPDLEQPEFQEKLMQKPLPSEGPLLYLVIKNKDIPFFTSLVPAPLIEEGRVYSLLKLETHALVEDVNQ